MYNVGSYASLEDLVIQRHLGIMFVGRPALVLGAYTTNVDSDESARLARAFIVGVFKVYREMMTQAK